MDYTCSPRLQKVLIVLVCNSGIVKVVVGKRGGGRGVMCINTNLQQIKRVHMEIYLNSAVSEHVQYSLS